MRRVIVSVIVTAVLDAGALVAQRAAPAANVPEVLIGSVLPLTGNFASLGQQNLWSAQPPKTS